MYYLEDLREAPEAAFDLGTDAVPAKPTLEQLPTT